MWRRIGIEEVGFEIRPDYARRHPAHAAGSRPGAAHLQSDRIDIRPGLADATGLPDGFADILVCNGVPLIVPDVEAALREMARIAKPGARVFIGEIPKANEQVGKNYGGSIGKWLVFVLRRQGIRAFGKCLRQVLVAMFSREPFIISPKKAFYMEPQTFTDMVERCGFRLIERFTHLEIDRAGIVYESSTRIDYLFRRV